MTPKKFVMVSILIIFEKSKLLSQLSIFTDAHQFDDGSYYPGEWKCYGIYTQNHIIDIIAQDVSVISVLKEEL